VKKFAPFILIALIAITIVLYQPFVVFGADDFTMTPDGYKVFSYGFPFRIVDCAAHLPMHMNPSQVLLRFIGNFAVFFLPGALIVYVIRRVLKSRVQPQTL
jgi:hypothetical protein